jgi:hypothetical protein
LSGDHLEKAASQTPPLVTIEDIRVPEVLPSEKEDDLTKGAVDDLFEQKLRRQKLENDNLEQDKKQRKRYARAVFQLICLWLFGLFVLVFFQGNEARNGFHLSDKVLITLITGTTANVLGIFWVVMNYLFPKR